VPSILSGELFPTKGPEQDVPLTAQPRPDPRRYFEAVGDTRGEIAEQEPVCLYIETTNRCNLLCETCPRTFEDLEPPADMSWRLFTRIVDQFPRIARVVLHGVGEPMMVKALPRMVRYLKDRGTYVLFNTNGTLLTERKGRELIAAGLDELRVSLDAAEPGTFLAVRGKDMFDRIVRNVRAFTALQRAERVERPLVSLWLTGLKETIDQLPEFVRLAHRIGVSEIYLQRLVFTPEGQGLARAQSALFERLDGGEAKQVAEAAALAEALGVNFNASGATEPGTSLKRAADDLPWALCRRPWTLMYFTAHGRAIPCCIAPFSMRGYDNFTLGDATQESLRQIWNGPRYQDFRRALLSDKPPAACASCGVRWSL
jgi:MoaA/NifB/PqqE/SkfB family radical SAM enzyme